MLDKIFPNVVFNFPIFKTAIYQTLEMLAITGTISFIISVILGIILVVTKKDGILSNLIIWNILDKIINLFRSIPFIILIAALIPLTRIISGTAIGVKGTIFPLIVGIVPFFARQIESSLNELDEGLIESGQVMGLSPMQIIWSIYLKESISSMARVTTITIISLVGLTAIVGVVGGGGIGDFAIQYGYQQNEQDSTIACILVLLVIVTIVQIIGTLISRRATH
ncbi:methionine ABC transporter permease [Paucilactobacillus wasatchensis]|uniref:Methionine ABC transporter permease protein n=1 Tax=Paucilactobacillus wasatchensis TaxID=1335616 RepID=A0A0D1A6X1_9LACO|nr:methionine ABC transporter permease [Paucilactobacillus wasatchensis]KIS03585.1 Methionine ABC transporter permease protein [Paucilactobacillus wasatchensis]